MGFWGCGVSGFGRNVIDPTPFSRTYFTRNWHFWREISLVSPEIRLLKAGIKGLHSLLKMSEKPHEEPAEVLEPYEFDLPNFLLAFQERLDDPEWEDL